MKIFTTTLLLMLGLNASAQTQDELQEGKILASYEETTTSDVKAMVYLIVDNVTGEVFESFPTTAELPEGSEILFAKKKYTNYNMVNHMRSHDIMARADY